MLGDVNKLFSFKTLLATPSNVLPLHLKQTFSLIIRIFTEGEGDGIESRLPFIFYFKLLKEFMQKNCAKKHDNKNLFTLYTYLLLGKFHCMKVP